MDFLFKGLTIEETTKLKKNISIKTNIYLRNNVVVYEDDICKNIAYINSGSITAKRIFHDGHETIIRILGKNDTFGEALIFTSNNTYKANFICDTRTSISFLNYDDLLYLINSSTIVSLNLFNKISENLVNLNNQLRILTKKSVKSKLCEFLFLEYSKNKQTTFSIPYNKTELALLLNTQRPTLSKELSSLIEDKVISNVGFNYTILDFKKFNTYL